jgi:hypothetical protein
MSSGRQHAARRPRDHVGGPGPGRWPNPPSSACAGFSLVEAATVGVVMTVVLIVLMSLMQVNRDGSRMIVRQTKATEALRKAADVVEADVMQSGSSRMTVGALADGNHALTLQMPASVTAGVVTWGVRDPSLGDDDATRARDGWFVRYTVVTALEGGRTVRNLVRQLLDGTLALQRQTVLMRDVRSGGAAQPGLRVVQNGMLWNVTMSVEAVRQGESGTSLSFDCWPRN